MGNIGVDLDGVIYSWHQAVYNELVIYWELADDFYTFWTKSYLTYKNQMFWDNLTRLEHLYSDQIPNKEDIDFLNELAKNNNLYYITNRPKEVMLATKNWLKRYDFPYKENLYFTTDKVAVANSLGITKFLEDRPSNIIALADAGIEVFVVNQPYNLADDFGNCVRVNNLSQLKGILC